MRLRLIALGCALTGAIGSLTQIHGTALAANTDLAKPRITISSPVTDNHYGARVRLTVSLGRTFTSNRVVSLYAAPFGGRRTLVATGRVNAQGKWYPTYPITKKTMFIAEFHGDAHDRPSSASLTLDAYARVAERLAGYYKTSRSRSGITYAVFHGRGTLTLYSTVLPRQSGACLEPETEQYETKGGWTADAKYGCDKLDHAGHDTAPFSLSQAVGARYRIRSNYLHAPGNTENLNAQGPWLYFIVTG